MKKLQLILTSLIIGIASITYSNAQSNKDTTNAKDEREQCGCGSLQDIFKGNEEWTEEILKDDPDFFKRLSQGQSPKYLFIGCSDSRVPAELLFGMGPGDIFVHRNIANVVADNDNSIKAVIQYAVEHLKVEHILICGHYDCGGVKAALGKDDLGGLNNWLQPIKEIYQSNKTYIDNASTKKEKIDKMVELNVREQCLNIMKMDNVQRSWKENKSPLIHGLIFDIETGKIIDLEIDTNEVYEEIKDAFGITF